MKTAEQCVICDSDQLDRSVGFLSPFVAYRIFKWKQARFDNGHIVYPACCSMKCRECGFQFCDMRFDDEEMQKLYKDYRGKEYEETRTFFQSDYKELNDKMKYKQVVYLDQIEELIAIQPVRVLDWGGSNGLNTPFKDAEIDIYDIGNDAVFYGTKVETPRPPYDLIVCSNVLEHVSYPKKMLHEIKQIMDAETLLYIEVPYETNDSIEWHEHINKFNDPSLHRLMKECGLVIVNEKEIPWEYDFVHVKMVVCHV